MRSVRRYVLRFLGDPHRFPGGANIAGWGRLLLWVYFLLWLGGAVFLYLRWQELSPWVKYPLALVEALIVPDTTVFRDLFGARQRSR